MAIQRTSLVHGSGHSRGRRPIRPGRRPTARVFAAAAACLLISVALFARGGLAQTATPGAPVRHPTGPPRGAPPPGSRCLGCGTAPEPIDYDDHAGWAQIFGGKTLNGWDGSPAVWKVEDGAITAENWPERRVDGTFIIWRGGEPLDFELKLEVKADYDVHSGIFYRSRVGPSPTGAGRGAGRARRAAVGTPGRDTAPAIGPRPPQQPIAVPADPIWNVRGYSMDWDYDPGNNGNIQDTAGGRIDTQIVWRGNIVRTEADKRPRAIGTLGDRDALMKLIKLGDWNQIHIIARGNELTQIVNGRVMAILIDDDPTALKTKGVIALQMERFGTGAVHFRNIWLKQ